MKPKNKQIIVGVSGGIDSSVALYLLQQEGWSPVGVTLQIPIWKEDSAFDVKDAQKVCAQLDIPHIAVDVKKEFKQRVVQYFRKELQHNFTPNPCIICNRFLKFDQLLDIADEKGVEHIATGHYARKKFNTQTERYQLLKGQDTEKDQSYMLSFLNQEQLARSVFPVGEKTADQIQQIAQQAGLKTALERESSQDFCYLAGHSLSDFIGEEIETSSGPIVNQEGEVLGEHPGVYFYTLGQRKGLDLPHGPYYVVGFEVENNKVVVSKNKSDLEQKEVVLSPFNFISGVLPKSKQRIQASVRYNQLPQSAIMYPPQQGRLKIVFAEPLAAVAPGQFCVFYQGQACLGGGRILNLKNN